MKFMVKRIGMLQIFCPNFKADLNFEKLISEMELAPGDLAFIAQPWFPWKSDWSSVDVHPACFKHDPWFRNSWILIPGLERDEQNGRARRILCTTNKWLMQSFSSNFKSPKTFIQDGLIETLNLSKDISSIALSTGWVISPATFSASEGPSCHEDYFV